MIGTPNIALCIELGLISFRRDKRAAPKRQRTTHRSREQNLRRGLRADGKTRKRRPYTQRVRQIGWTDEQKRQRRLELQRIWHQTIANRNLAAGLTYDGKSRRRTYTPRADLTGWTEEQKHERRKQQQREAMQRLRAKRDTLHIITK